MWINSKDFTTKKKDLSELSAKIQLQKGFD